MLYVCARVHVCCTCVLGYTCICLGVGMYTFVCTYVRICPYNRLVSPVASSVVTLGPALPGPPAGEGTGVLEPAGERAIALGTGRSVDLI